MKIVVLCGGMSTERKISLSSGSRVCLALRKKGHQAVLVDLFMGLEGEEYPEGHPEALFENLPPVQEVVFDGKTPDLEEVRRSRKLQSRSLFGQDVLEICQAADVVYNALHGMNGEDGRVQAVFDMFGIPYTGSGCQGAALAMNKTITKILLKNRGMRTPAFASYYADPDKIPELAEEILQTIGVPCAVKTPRGGSSVGVFIVKSKEGLEGALRECIRYEREILVEQFVEGREFTCAVLKDRALPSVEIEPLTRFYDYENKYRAGATREICPGRCSAEVEKEMGEMALLAHKALGLKTYSRSDFIIDEDGKPWFLEVNTLPGMTPTSLVPQEAAAVGISYADLCEMIVEDAL